MEWHLQYGEKLEWFLDLEAEGKSVPALDTMPELFPDLKPYWDAFQTLSSSRQSGMGLGYIPFSEIIHYLGPNWLNITDLEERQDYVNFIRVLDHEYVKFQSNKAESDRKSKGK